MLCLDPRLRFCARIPRHSARAPHNRFITRRIEIGEFLASNITTNALTYVYRYYLRVYNLLRHLRLLRSVSAPSLMSLNGIVVDSAMLGQRTFAKTVAGGRSSLYVYIYRLVNNYCIDGALEGRSIPSPSPA